MAVGSPWWAAHIHQDRRPTLRARARIKARLRDYFVQSAFAEVECGALQLSPGNEAHLHAFRTEWIAAAGGRHALYLHSSPEFACKKLLAAGEQRIFEFARVFRNRERGPLHAPEFTMLEWYRAGEPYEAAGADCLTVLRLAAETAGAKSMSFRDRSCDPLSEPERLRVGEAFLRHAGIDLLATLSEDGTGRRDVLAVQAVRAGHTVAENDNWADIFSKVLAGVIEPKLGTDRPTILYEYPRCEAALEHLDWLIGKLGLRAGLRRARKHLAAYAQREGAPEALRRDLVTCDDAARARVLLACAFDAADAREAA